MRKIISILFLVLSTSTVFGHPYLQLRRPVNLPRHGNLELRSFQDPACPDGYVCNQDSCSSDVKCPDGTVCISLEGNIACAPPGHQWCALNPSTFQAVSCSVNDLCCHGNCYDGNAVCCDNPGMVCSVGNLCGVCNPGQTCGNNGACQGGGSSSISQSLPPITTSISKVTNTPITVLPITTTSKIPITTTSASKIPTTTTTTNAVTTSQQTSSPSKSPTMATTTVLATTSTSKPTTSTSIIKPTTTNSVPSPTIIPSVDPFESPTCFVDTTDSRILINGSSIDHTSTGITVPKCVELADGWRFAGVEFGGECYWGDIMQNEQGSPLDQCDMACDGDSSEICGGGNRILIYEDPTWTIPSRIDLADTLETYNENVVKFHDLIQQLQDEITTYDQQQQNTKRQLANVNGDLKTRQTPIITLDLIIQTRAQVIALGQVLDGSAKLITTLFNTARNYIKISSEEYGDYVELRNLVKEQAVAIASDAVIELGTAAARKAALQILSGALDFLGNPLTLVEGTVYKTFRGSSGSTGPTQPLTQPITTSTVHPTTTSTSASTTCTATATTTPIIIVTKKGTTIEQFNELVNSLPSNKDNVQRTDSWLPNWLYIATLDECTSQELWNNPIVAAMSFDAELDVGVDEVDGTTTLRKRSSVRERPRERKRNARSAPAGKASPADSDLRHEQNLTDRFVAEPLIERGNPTAESFFKIQNPSPDHLSWISQLSRLTRLTGSFLDFEKFLFDDSIARQSKIPTVYVIDTGFLNTHVDFASRVVRNIGPDGEPQAFAEGSHGTCMVSLAAGNYSGVGKHADIVTVQFDTSGIASPVNDKVRFAVFALLSIYQDVVTKSLQGMAVVSMSFGVARNLLWWLGPTGPLVPDTGISDVFQIYVPLLWDVGVVVLCSAGNRQLSGTSAASRDLSSQTPRNVGGAGTPLIVVGNAQADGSRNPTSQFLDQQNKGILTIYNIGTNVECANRVPSAQETTVDAGTTWGTPQAGTSQATAITAGMVAYYLSDATLNAGFRAQGIGGVAAAVKAFLISTSMALKGDANTGDGLPRAALGEVVPCQGGTIDLPPIPAPYVLPVGDPHNLRTRDVTSGTTVVFNPPPQCFDLP